MTRRAHLCLSAFALLATAIYVAEVAIVRMRPGWGPLDDPEGFRQALER